MISFADKIHSLAWEHWFQYVMITVALLGIALVASLAIEEIPMELLGVLLFALIAHHLWIFYLAHWKEKNGGVDKMSRINAWRFAIHFYLFMIGAPIYLVVGYLSYEVGA